MYPFANFSNNAFNNNSNNSNTTELVTTSSSLSRQKLLDKQAAELKNIGQNNLTIRDYGFCLQPSNLILNQQINSNQSNSANNNNFLFNSSEKQTINGNSNKTNSHSSSPKWVNLLISYLEDRDENSSINTQLFINEYEQISQETPLSMLEWLKRQLEAPSNYKSNSKKLKILRLQLVLNFLDKINYNKKPSNIFLKDKSSKEMIEDIHTIATCHTENSIKASIFDLFIINSKEYEENSSGASLDQTIKTAIINSKHTIEKVELENSIQFESLNKKLSVFENYLNCLKKENCDLKTQNELILSKLNTLLDCDNESDHLNKRKQAKNARSNSPSNQAVQPTSVNAILDNNNVFKNLKSALVNNHNLVTNVKEPTEASSIPFTYSAALSQVNLQAKSNPNNNWKKVEQTKTKTRLNVRKISENGVTKIVNNNNSNENNQNSNNSIKRNSIANSKNIIIGTAISNVKSLKAVSRPFYYYTGQWSNKTDIDSLRSYVNNFAKVINIEELSTHIQNRKHKSFKLVVESYCNEAIIDSSNWPGGVQVTRWRGPTKKPKNYNQFNEQQIVTGTNQKQLNFQVNNKNKHIINNQMIENTGNIISKSEFFKSLGEMKEKNAQIKNNNAVQDNNLREDDTEIIVVDENEQDNEQLNDINCNTQNLTEMVDLINNQAKSSTEEASNDKSN